MGVTNYFQIPFLYAYFLFNVIKQVIAMVMVLQNSFGNGIFCT